VKLIGATCHHVTAGLDEGPIIEQDTRRIDHGDSVEDLRRVRRDVERTLLALGLRWHLEGRVFVNGSKDGRLRVGVGFWIEIGEYEPPSRAAHGPPRTTIGAGPR
jgi:folate-dependent phosphoribosylglycinamide formyltransferase PurN